MEWSAWLGLAVGLGIGLIYGLWQAWDMRAGPSAAPTMARTWRAAARLLFLMVALLAVLRWTAADKVWLVVGTALGYSVMFGVRLKRILTKQKTVKD